MLACGRGKTNTEIAAELGCHQVTIAKWRHRFAADRLEGLADAPRPGAARTIGDDVIEAVVVGTLETTPGEIVERRCLFNLVGRCGIWNHSRSPDLKPAAGTI